MATNGSTASVGHALGSSEEGGAAYGGAISMRQKVDRMERNEGIVSRFLNEPEFQEMLSRELARRSYRELRPAP